MWQSGNRRGVVVEKVQQLLRTLPPRIVLLVRRSSDTLRWHRPVVGISWHGLCISLQRQQAVTDDDEGLLMTAVVKIIWHVIVSMVMMV